jgi:hypothetical protein
MILFREVPFALSPWRPLREHGFPIVTAGREFRSKKKGDPVAGIALGNPRELY